MRSGLNYNRDGVEQNEEVEKEMGEREREEAGGGEGDEDFERCEGADSVMAPC